MERMMSFNQIVDLARIEAGQELRYLGREYKVGGFVNIVGRGSPSDCENREWCGTLARAQAAASGSRRSDPRPATRQPALVSATQQEELEMKPSAYMVRSVSANYKGLFLYESHAFRMMTCPSRPKDAEFVELYEAEIAQLCPLSEPLFLECCAAVTWNDWQDASKFRRNLERIYHVLSAKGVENERI